MFIDSVDQLYVPKATICHLPGQLAFLSLIGTGDLGYGQNFEMRLLTSQICLCNTGTPTNFGVQNL